MGAHAPEEAWDVKNKRCEALGCTRQPVFGVEPGVARWCAAHAPEEAWDVKSKRCEALGCTKQPSFGVEPGVARWCAAHAPEEAWAGGRGRKSRRAGPCEANFSHTAS